MRIVSWNCSSKFREKFNKITELKADIYVIQECENPKKYVGSEYSKFAKNYFWVGNNENKGLGVFADENIELSVLDWYDNDFRFFLPCKINRDIEIIGLWACEPYIEEFYDFQDKYIDRFSDNCIIMGDLNSNSFWDKRFKKKCHTNVVSMLENRNFISAYHYKYNEKQGSETMPTFYLYKQIQRPYHLDFCFLSKQINYDFKVLDTEHWLKYSDHIPILLDIN